MQTYLKYLVYNMPEEIPKKLLKKEREEDSIKKTLNEKIKPHLFHITSMPVLTEFRRICNLNKEFCGMTFYYNPQNRCLCCNNDSISDREKNRIQELINMANFNVSQSKAGRPLPNNKDIPTT